MSDTLNLFPSEGITQASAIATAGAANPTPAVPVETPASPATQAPPATSPPVTPSSTPTPAVPPSGTPPPPSAEQPPAQQPDKAGNEPGAPGAAAAAPAEQPPAQQAGKPGSEVSAPGAAAGGVPAPAEQVPGTPTEAEMLAAAQRKWLEELGIESMDDLKARLTPPAALTPEEIKKQNDLRKAEVQSYAVQKLGMTVEDFAHADQIATQDDETVVFNAFKKHFITENQANPAFKGKNLEEEARYRFEQFYHINSEDEALREMGQRGLALTAQSFKAAVTGKITEASNSYTRFKQDQVDFQRFDEMLKKYLPEQLPKTMTYEAAYNDKGEKIKVDFSLEGITVEDLMKALKTDYNFELYRTKGLKEAFPALQAQVANYIRIKKHDNIVQAALLSGYSQGLQAGKVGPNAPFPISPAAPVQSVQPGQLTQADIDKVAKVVGGAF